MHVQSCCFANQTYCFFLPFSLPSASSLLKLPIVASQHTHNHALKEKSKYCLYPKEHSTVEKGRWKTKGGGILFCVESLWMQVKVKTSCELKRYVPQNIRTIRSNSWNCTVNKFVVLANLYSARLCCIHFPCMTFADCRPQTADCRLQTVDCRP